MRILGMMGAVVLAGAIAAAAPAQAAIMAATFYGVTPFGGYDYAGVFGAPGSLSYRSASLTFTYDTERGARMTDAGQDFVYGGSQFGLESPFLSAKVTIGDASYDLDLQQYAFINSYETEWTWIAGRQETPGNNATEVGVTLYHSAPGDLDAPLTAYDFGSGYFRLYKPDADEWGELLAETEFEFGGVEIAYVGPSPGSGAVPEPATWALMITGFGLAGAALRRRRMALGSSRRGTG